MAISNFSEHIISAEKATEETWDVIIVGAGMGGSATAYKLATNGLKVLLVEKGLSNFKTEDILSVTSNDKNEEQLFKSGQWPTELHGTLNNKKINLWPPLGNGLGGSTLLYAAALQRLRPEDFETRELPNGQTLEWPYSYEEIEPYYREAETLFSVKGTYDPLEKIVEKDQTLEAPPAMCERDISLFQSFKNNGLNPYRLHVGIKYKPDCNECGGIICEKECKNDARNTLIKPALLSNNLSILELSEVTHIDEADKSVTNICISKQGKSWSLKAKVYVLAAGGYITPSILLRSTSKFMKGAANSSGLVGKNLMFHTSDFIAVWAKNKKLSTKGSNKTIAIRDFYSYNGTKLGEFQSTGLSAGYGNILYSLNLLFDQSIFRKIPFARHFLRIPAKIAEKVLGEATLFATIVEDYPKLENEIEIDANNPSGISFNYSVDEDLLSRTKQLSKLIISSLKDLKAMSMNITVTPNWGHPCGTCKAGLDPNESVVNKNCRSHDLENLYISDSSFMPTSGGTNPSLTIAANALRVGDKIIEELERK